MLKSESLQSGLGIGVLHPATPKMKHCFGHLGTGENNLTTDKKDARRYKIRVYLCTSVVKNLNLMTLSVTLKQRGTRKQSVQA